MTVWSTVEVDSITVGRFIMGNDRTSGRNRGIKTNLDALLKKGVAEQEQCRQAKRQAQHNQWMRVMQEGQSTPDLSYQKIKA